MDDKLIEVVIAALRSSGYDGLCNDDCGCGFEDFAPCGECYCYCTPAYNNPQTAKSKGFDNPDATGNLSQLVNKER